VVADRCILEDFINIWTRYSGSWFYVFWPISGHDQKVVFRDKSEIPVFWNP
jgi:hypothetical protein